MSTLHYHQRATLEPVYRRVEILEQFTISLRRAYEELVRRLNDLEAPLEPYTKIEDARFHFVRRMWRRLKTDPTPHPYFAYAYFNQSSFDAALIRRSLYESDDSPGFQAFLDQWREVDHPPQAALRAIHWLRSRHDPGEPGYGEELHHSLLMLYSRTAIAGGIQDTLLSHFRTSTPRQALRPIYVRTLDKASANGSELPKLQICPLGDSLVVEEIDQLPLSGLGGPTSPATLFFLNRLDPWFRHGPTGCIPGRTERINLQMLWIPLFDFYAEDGAASGMFLGWAFQFLGPQKAVFLEQEEHRKVLRTYAEICQVALPLLSDRLYEQAMREVASQDVVAGDPTETLCKHIHFLEGWATARLDHESWAQERPGRTARPIGTGAENGFDVSLRMTRFDDPRLWGETDRPTGPGPTLRLTPLDRAEFSPPPDGAIADKYQDKVAARIRELYRHFRLTDLRVRRAEEAEAQRIKGDLVATFAHTFGKVGDAIAASLSLQSSQSLVKRLRGRLTAAAELSSIGSTRDVLLSLSNELEPLATADSNPGVNLFRNFFLPQVAGFYERVLLLDRLRGTTSTPSLQRLSIVELVDDVIRGRLLDVARHLQAGNVDETYKRLANGRPVSDLRTISGGGLVSFHEDSAAFFAFLPVAQDDGLAGLLLECWKTVFFELLINALEGDGLTAAAGAPAITLSCRNDTAGGEGIVRLENTIALDSTRRVAGRTADGWDLLEIRRPTAEQGTRGWGQYGVKFILEQVLRSGTLRASRQPVEEARNGRVLARFDVILWPGWWGKAVEVA